MTIFPAFTQDRAVALVLVRLAELPTISGDWITLGVLRTDLQGIPPGLVLSALAQTAALTHESVRRGTRRRAHIEGRRDVRIGGVTQTLNRARAQRRVVARVHRDPSVALGRAALQRRS